LTKPNTAPTLSAASNAHHTPPVWTATMASTTLVTVSTAPIERSSPSVMMMSVMGSAISSSTVDCVAMFTRLADVRKVSVIQENTTHNPIRVISAPLEEPDVRTLRNHVSAPADRFNNGSAMVHPQGQDSLLTHLLAVQMPGNASFAHHISAIANVDNFGQLGTKSSRQPLLF